MKKYKIKTLIHPSAYCILVNGLPLDEDRLRGLVFQWWTSARKLIRCLKVNRLLNIDLNPLSKNSQSRDTIPP